MSMGPAYNFGIRCMQIALNIAALKSGKIRQMLKGQKESLAHIARTAGRLPAHRFDYWIHVASLGEFEQSRPVIEAIKKDNPGATLLLTFFSPSGYNVRKDYPLADCVAYLPIDTPENAKNLVKAANPRAAIFVKYEFWGNYLTTLKNNGIPVSLVSAIFRPGQIFFRPWGGTFRQMLQAFAHIYVQDTASQNLLTNIGIGNVTVAGDTRLDRVANIAQNAVAVPGLENWVAPGDFVLVAGSSWQPDEKLYIPWIKNHSEVKAIIAPHQFDEERLNQLEQTLGLKCCRLTQISGQNPIPSDCRVLIVDTFGQLANIYRYGTVALIGGGFGAGIHNINEPAAHGLPVLFGPNSHKFKEASDLLNLGAALQYHDQASLNQALDTLYNDDAARQHAAKSAAAYVRVNRGATQTILKTLPIVPQ